MYSSYHVRFIESHEAPAERTDSFPDRPHVGNEPFTVEEIARGAESMPILFDREEEEELLPTNLRQPIPDDPLNQPIPDAPESIPEDPPNLIDQGDDERPETPAIINDVVPGKPRRSNRQRKGMDEPTRLQKTMEEIKGSAQRKAEERTERRKRLADIREEERRNEPNRIEEQAKRDLGDLENPSTMPKINDQVLPSEELHKLFEKLNIRDEGNISHSFDTTLSAIADCSALSAHQFAMDAPKNWEDAQTRPEAAEWKAAIDEELKSLRDMKVYKLTCRSDLPQGTKVRKGSILLLNKIDENGDLARRKARFVFKGYEQRWGIDYTNTTSPTARMESWRILLHIAASLEWDAQQIDIKTAFLYGLLPDDEVQYMEQPKGFEESGKETWVWKLERGLYGMKQSGRIWNRTMNEAMLSWGFTRLSCESCIYYRKEESGTLVAAVHVDDFLSIASKLSENERFKAQMREIWKISSSGEAKYCVGIGIMRNHQERTILLSQTALIDKIICQFGQQDSFPTNSPMDPGLKLRRPEKKSIQPEEQHRLDRLPYRSLVGCLIYLSVGTRPDIAYAVQQLSQFLDSYAYAHWNAALRVVQYLKGTKDLKLTLGGDRPVGLIGFTDSDWANCLDTRRSIGGYGFTLGSGLISWNAKKQKTVATSSCEAEYTAAFEAAKESIWLRNLMASIGFKQPSSTLILCDNNAAINLSEDPSLHQRVKHIDIKYHFLREHVNMGDITLKYINTNDNIADIFTKALEHRRFARLRNLLGLK